MIAEGVVLGIAPEDLAGLDAVERDAHGHIRIDEVSIGDILKVQVMARLRELGIKTTIAAKNIGYELRCADPIPFDMEYTRDLGYCAAGYLASGQGSSMISIQGGRFVPIPFDTMIDPGDRPHARPLGRRHLDPLRHRAALHDRLKREDFEDPHDLAKLAATAHLGVDEFRERFGYLTRTNRAGGHRAGGPPSFPRPRGFAPRTSRALAAYLTISVPFMPSAKCPGKEQRYR